jgi:hypothetical protein
MGLYYSASSSGSCTQIVLTAVWFLLFRIFWESVPVFSFYRTCGRQVATPRVSAVECGLQPAYGCFLTPSISILQVVLAASVIRNFVTAYVVSRGVVRIARCAQPSSSNHHMVSSWRPDPADRVDFFSSSCQCSHRLWPCISKGNNLRRLKRVMMCSRDAFLCCWKLR